MVPQHAVLLPDGWALTQGRDNSTKANTTDDLILTHFNRDQQRHETYEVLRGGHGDRAYEVGGYLVVQIKGAWSRVRFGSPVAYFGVSAPERCALRGEDNLQGEARLPDGRWLRLYGGSIKADPKWHPGENAYLQVIDGTAVAGKVDLDDVARDPDGAPIGGRYEPEGLQVVEIDGVPWVLVGFSVGQLGNTTMRVYGRPARFITTEG